MSSRIKPIPGALLALVKETDKKRFIQDYAEANFVLDIIKGAIEKKIELLQTKEEDEKLLSDPGYVSKYTHFMGQRKMAKELLNLFPKKG